jgi:ribosomal protein S18 acetylase RimI-like enzyme
MNSSSICATQKRPVVRPFNPGDRPWAKRLLEERWGSTCVVARGQLYDLLSVPAMVALFDSTPCGLATYHVVGTNCQLTSLDACDRGLGIGTALLGAVVQTARQHGCDRLWLITTNDNLDALRFYQRRGFQLAAVHPDALSQSRQLKPGIPPVGNYGIPLRDEIELEMRLEPST